MSSVISQPWVTTNIIGASVDISNTAQKVLYIGQKTPDGFATPLTIYDKIGTNDQINNGFFGPSSMLSAMLRGGRSLNKEVQFDAIALDDDLLATKATTDVVITGVATETTEFEVVIGSRKDGRITVVVPVDADAETVGESLVTALAARPTMPVTATNLVTGIDPDFVSTVTLEAVNGGTLGNEIGIELIGEVLGLTITVPSGFSGGAGDPDLTTLLTLAEGSRYQTVVWPYGDPNDLAVIHPWLDSRFNINNDIMDGVAICSVNDITNDLLSLGSSLNSKSLVLLGDKKESGGNYHAPAIFELPWVKSALFAAIRSLRLTDGANISQYIISKNGALDSFGGPALASKPYFNTPVPGLVVPNIDKGFSSLEIEQLFDAGISVIGTNRTMTQVIMGELLSTYKTDSASNEDISFKFLNYIDSASNAREYFSNNLRARFAQSRLTEGDLVDGRDVANAVLIRAACVEYYTDLAGPDYVLVQDGEDALQYFIANLDVTLDLSIGKATIMMVVPIVTQLRIILATMQISFSAEG